MAARGLRGPEPDGWDSFGLPAENAAIRQRRAPGDVHPRQTSRPSNESFKRYAVPFDWSWRLHTSDPEYYRWTQWLFLKFRERGLAYRKSSPVNWCPNDQTVLANEQVVDGRCECCGADVTKRELTQWYFKITEYAQGAAGLPGRPGADLAGARRHRPAQLGSAGPRAHVSFVVEGDEPITVYTTRPDTIFGTTTFMVVAVDSPLAAELVTDGQRAAFEAYREEIRKETEIERLATDRPKTGGPGGPGDQPG